MHVVPLVGSIYSHSKIIVCSVYLLRTINADSAITGDVYEVYRELCGQLGIEVLTQRRVSGLINELDINGVLNSRVVSLGRYGRTKKIRLGVSVSVVKEVFFDDPWTVQLINYTPKCLKRDK